MEKQCHQDANKDEDPQHHGIQYSPAWLRNMVIHGQNKKNVTGVRKQVLQKNHESEMDTVHYLVRTNLSVLEKIYHLW